MNYSLFCGLVFLLLERDAQGRWQMGPGRTLLVSLLWFSVGQGPVLAALIAYLFWLTRNRNYLVCLVALAAAMLLNASAQNEYRPESTPGPAQLARIYFESIAVRLGFLSVLPYRFHGAIRGMGSAPFMLLSLALLGGYLWATFKARWRDAQGSRVLAIAVLSAMAIYPLTALARNYGVVAFTRTDMSLGGRHGLVPAVLALLLLWQWLARAEPDVFRAAAASLFLAWTTFCVLHEPYYQPPNPPLAPPGEWRDQATTIDDALRARRAGTLREAVVIRKIRCRPVWSSIWRIRGLTIAPEPTPSGPPPPRM
jgi:hypothetical protein